MKERVGDNFSQFFPEAAQVVSNKKEITFVLGNSDLIKNPSTGTLNPYKFASALITFMN